MSCILMHHCLITHRCFALHFDLTLAIMIEWIREMQAVPVAEAAAHVASLRAMTKPKLQEPTTHASYDAKLPPRITHVAHTADVLASWAESTTTDRGFSRQEQQRLRQGSASDAVQGLLPKNEHDGLHTDGILHCNTPAAVSRDPFGAPHALRDDLVFESESRLELGSFSLHVPLTFCLKLGLACISHTDLGLVITCLLLIVLPFSQHDLDGPT